MILTSCGCFCFCATVKNSATQLRYDVEAKEFVLYNPFLALLNSNVNKSSSSSFELRFAPETLGSKLELEPQEISKNNFLLYKVGGNESQSIKIYQSYLAPSNATYRAFENCNDCRVLLQLSTFDHPQTPWHKIIFLGLDIEEATSDPENMLMDDWFHAKSGLSLKQGELNLFNSSTTTSSCSLTRAEADHCPLNVDDEDRQQNHPNFLATHFTEKAYYFSGNPTPNHPNRYCL